MESEWNTDKELKNIEKHGVDFTEAMTVFGDPLELTISDPKHSIDEFRFLSIGYSFLNRLLVVSYTEREDSTRIISAQTASLKGELINQVNEEDIMFEEYDFSKGVRGKHYKQYRKGTNLVLLNPEMAQIFKDSASVNAALKMLVQIAPDYVAETQKNN